MLIIIPDLAAEVEAFLREVGAELVAVAGGGAPDGDHGARGLELLTRGHGWELGV